MKLLITLALIFIITLSTHATDYSKMSVSDIRKAADAGDRDAQYELGTMYEMGNLELKHNKKLAKFWYRKAAEQGQRAAWVALGDKSIPEPPSSRTTITAPSASLNNTINGGSSQANQTTAPKGNAVDDAETPFAKLNKGDYDGAIAEYNSGHAKADKGDFDGAIADYTKAIELQPDLMMGAYNNRGHVKINKGDFDGAIADYTKAIETAPKPSISNQIIALPYWNRGNAKKGKGDFEGAIADYNKAIELKPDFAEAYKDRSKAIKAKADLNSTNADIAQESHPATITGESIHKESAATNRPSDWGARLNILGWVEYDRQGIANHISGHHRSGNNEISIQMLFENSPKVKVATDVNGKKFLLLPVAVEKRKTTGKLVITTPVESTADFLIPDCLPTTQSFDSPNLSLFITKFINYSGDFRFILQIESSPPDQQHWKIHDMDFFSDGSEHHIYGHVKLFGAAITNTEKEPLVFRLSGDCYEYVSGKGTATTADGLTLTFGY